MKVFNHHIYEYRKGIRNLFLCTLSAECEFLVRRKLTKYKIPYLIRPINEKKINVFFGASECIEVLLSFDDKPLNEFSDKEDFMLGIMLGYDCKIQCARYTERKKAHERIDKRKSA